MVGRGTSEEAPQRDNKGERESGAREWEEGGDEGGEVFAWRVFCKCQEQRVDGFINPLSLQNTWRRRGGERGEEWGRLVREERRRYRGREGDSRQSRKLGKEER